MRLKLLILTLLLPLFGARAVFADSLLINEFMAHPTTGNDEWVEFYNPSSIDLTTYWLDDDTSFTDDTGSSTKKPLSTINTTNSTYPYLEFGSFLNNSGDYVVLFSSDGTIVDQYQYTSDPGTDASTGRSPDGEIWTILSSASKGNTNGSPPPTPSPTPAATTAPASSSTPTPTPSSESSSSSSSFTISNIPSSIDSTEEFKTSVNLSVPKNPNTVFYLKGAFKKVDESNYFGFTQVGSSWVRNNQGYEDQFKITTNGDGNWSGDLQIQPDVLDSGYDGAGEYIFKVGRYTTSGSLTWSNEAKISIKAQAIVMDDDNKVLGITKQDETTTTKSSYKDDYSLEKYIKISTPSSKATSSANPKAQVKGTQINYLITIGSLLVIIGGSLPAYGIYNKFRKRN